MDVWGVKAKQSTPCMRYINFRNTSVHPLTPRSLLLVCIWELASQNHFLPCGMYSPRLHAQAKKYTYIYIITCTTAFGNLPQWVQQQTVYSRLNLSRDSMMTVQQPGIRGRERMSGRARCKPQEGRRWGIIYTILDWPLNVSVLFLTTFSSHAHAWTLAKQIANSFSFLSTKTSYFRVLSMHSFPDFSACYSVVTDLTACKTLTKKDTDHHALKSLWPLNTNVDVIYVRCKVYANTGR